MLPDIGRGIGEAILSLLIILVVCLPLALWKLLEIVHWLFTHISINW